MFKFILLFIKRHLYTNQLLYILSLMVFLFGVWAGAYSIKLNPGENESLTSGINLIINGFNMESIDLNIIFIESLLNRFNTILLILLFAATIIGAPAILFMIGAKGYALGFTVGLIMERFNLQGLKTVLILIFPQLLFWLPALMFFSVACIRLSLYFIHKIFGKNLKFNKKFKLNELFLIFFITCILFLISALLEGYISPMLLKILQ